LDTVIAEAQQAANSKPKDPSRELLLGYALLHAGEDRQQEAIMYLKGAADDADPRSAGQADMINIIVTQFDSIGIASGAIAVLEKLVRRGASPTVRHALACRYWEQGQWQKCIDMLGDVTPTDAKPDAELLALKLVAYSNLNKPEDVATYRAALGKIK